MGKTFTENGITYLYISEEKYYIVGSKNESIGDTSWGDYDFVPTAISQDSTVKDIVIPETVNGIAIREIGTCAFSYAYNLETITIKAKLISINSYAFYSCIKLTKINIPNTVKYIGYAAISCITKSGYTSSGALSIKFDPNSTIQFIDKYGIERKETIIIYFCGNIEPTIKDSALFYGANYTAIVSPISMSWCNISTAPDPSLCRLFSIAEKIEHIQTCRKKKSISLSVFCYSLLENYFNFNRTNKNK